MNQRGMRKRRACRLLLLLGLGLALAGAAEAQTSPPADPSATATGLLRGTVREVTSGRPLTPANVVIVGTRRGTISQSDGSFLIDQLPPGLIEVRISYLGYAPQLLAVEIVPGGDARLHVRLEPQIVGTLETIEIRAERPLVDVHKTSTAHTLSSQDLEALITEAPTIDAVVAQQPGVVRDRGKLHFRGGRSDENLFVVDGVKVKDLLSGQSTGDEIATQAAAQVDVITGGFGARYSQAMSGVVNARLKEGSTHWHGRATYESDALFDAYDLHHAYGELGGPNLALHPILRWLGDDDPAATFFASVSGDFSDGYLPNIRDLGDQAHLHSALEDRILGITFGYGDFFTPRATNRWRAILKTAWRADANNKLSLSWTKTLGFQQDWGAADIGDIDRNANNFPWSWARRLDRHYTISSDTNILSLIWNRTFGLNTRASMQIWRHYTGRHTDVAAQGWSEYDYKDRDSYLPWQLDTPYFVDVGDAPQYSDQQVIVWGLRNDWQWETGAHAFSWGLEAEYHDVQYFRMDTRTISEQNNLPLGTEFDLFHVTPNAGNLYLQDQFEYEGLSTNLGLVYDYWFPGEQVENALAAGTQAHMTNDLRETYTRQTYELFGRRFKHHLSPRLGVSFPINEQANLFFNYGHYSQRPPYYYVYAKTSSQSGEEYPRIGNPTLNPEISVQYEIGTGYQFSDAAAAKLTLFWKDMYDYPTSVRIVMSERQTKRSNFFMYWNMDYARSRGIELSLQRRRRNFWSGSLAYTYSVAKGKSSDPNKTKLIQELGGDSRETELGEEFLWWNRPHKLTARLSFQVREQEQPPTWLGFPWPRDLALTLYYMIRSGRAYTPLSNLGEEVGDPYSRNGPYDTTCDLSLSKGFRIAGRRLEASLRVYNLFEYRTPLVFDYVTGKAYAFGQGSLDKVLEDPGNYYLSDEELVTRYYEETGKVIAAENLRKEIIETLYAYSNPAYRGAPRTIRVGLSYAW